MKRYMLLFVTLCTLCIAPVFAEPAEAPPTPPAATPPARPDSPSELDSDRLPKTVTHGNCFITNATILTVTRGTIENGSIIVRDGKIIAVGAGLTAPAGFTVIDAHGGFVMPGIIDCHSHIAIERGVNEGSDSITAEVRIHDTINPDDVSIYRALAGGVTTIHQLHGSANTIGGQLATTKLKYKRPVEELYFPGAPQTIKFALGENVTQANFGDAASRFPGTRMGVEATLRRGFTAARDYQREWDAYEQSRRTNPNAVPPRRDLRLEALAKILKGEILIHCHSYRQDEILMLMRVAEDFGFRVMCFQHVLEGYKVAPEMAKHGAGGSTFSDWWAYKVEAYDAIPYNAALMAAAGVVVSLNSDSGELMRRLYHEAAKAMHYGGVSETEALKMITLNPAIQMGIDKKVGSIEAGKDADFAIFNGHPLSVYSICMTTIIDGEVYFERPDAFGMNGQLPPPVHHVESKPLDLPFPALVKDGTIAITGATIYPVTGAPIPNGTIVLDKGHITAIGVKVSIPRGATVVKADGLRVYPGLIDCSTTLGLTEIDSIRGTLDNADIGRIQPDLVTMRAINPASEHIPVARGGGITTAVSRPSGGLISGQGSIIHLAGWTVEEMVVKSPWALYINFPSVPRFGGGGGGGGGGAQPQTSTVLKELRDLLDSAREYKRLKDAAQAAHSTPPEVDTRLEALLPYISKEKPVVINVGRANDIREAIKFGEEQGLRIILSGADEAWKVADLLAEKKVPVILGSVLATPSNPYDPYDTPYTKAALLARVGVQFVFSTGDAADVRNLNHHAGMSAAFGLAPDEALKCITINSARLLGLGDQIGSLEVGKIADVIITDGDPLELTTHVRYMFIGGRPVSLESKQTRLYELYRQRLAAK